MFHITLEGYKGIDCELLAKKKPSSVKKSKNRLAEKHGLFYLQTNINILGTKIYHIPNKLKNKNIEGFESALWAEENMIKILRVLKVPCGPKKKIWLAASEKRILFSQKKIH